MHMHTCTHMHAHAGRFRVPQNVRRIAVPQDLSTSSSDCHKREQEDFWVPSTDPRPKRGEETGEPGPARRREKHVATTG